MTVKTYYLSKVAEAKLSTNFKVKEFACRDGSDRVLIDSELVIILQKIRNHFKTPVKITSAYRTPSYNASVGGSSTSYHVKGQAVDIQVVGVNSVRVGMYADTLGVGGIGVYSYVGSGFVHLDTRSIKFRWLQIEKNKGYQQVSKIMPTLRQGISNNENAVILVQRTLGVSQSGTFGETTANAVKRFQRKWNLVEDGIVGRNTWTMLFL